MMKKTLIALALIGTAAMAQAGTENFNNVSALQAAGWVITNASTPGGTTGWAQGEQNVFPAQAGPSDSYITSNYNAAAAGGQIDNWLITPTFSTTNFGSVSFWIRAAADAGFSDQLSWGMSDGGVLPAAFQLTSALTVGTDGWTQYTYDFLGTGAHTFGRFAIRYSGAADDSSYVGIDSLEIDLPEPSTPLMLTAGLLGLFAVRRRKQG